MQPPLPPSPRVRPPASPLVVTLNPGTPSASPRLSAAPASARITSPRLHPLTRTLSDRFGLRHRVFRRRGSLASTELGTVLRSPSLGAQSTLDCPSPTLRSLRAITGPLEALDGLVIEDDVSLLSSTTSSLDQEKWDLLLGQDDGGHQSRSHPSPATLSASLTRLRSKEKLFPDGHGPGHPPALDLSLPPEVDEYEVSAPNTSRSQCQTVPEETGSGTDTPTKKRSFEETDVPMEEELGVWDRLTLQFAELPAALRLVILLIVIFFLYGFYSYYQELIFRRGFTSGWFMTLMQSAAFVVFAGVARYPTARESFATSLRNLPFDFVLLALLQVAAMGLSNQSLLYLNYPAQIVFKSSKLIPVMIGGFVVLGKSYSPLEYVSAAMLVIGLIWFSMADISASPDFNLLGVTLVCLSLLADAFLPNVQEKVLNKATQDGAKIYTATDLIFFSHFCAFAMLFGYILAIGDLTTSLTFIMDNPSIGIQLVIFAFISYVGISVVLVLVQQFSGITAVTVTSCRKMFSMILSYVIFPKPFTPWHIVAAVVVFSGITLNVMEKNFPWLNHFFYHLVGRVPPTPKIAPKHHH